jgi:hypothetical protein
MWVIDDPNLSPNAIINKILGSSITSLSTVICDLIVYMGLALHNCPDAEGLSPTEIANLVIAGPWYAVDDGRQFMSPCSLYNGASKGNRFREYLTRDFEMMENLLNIYLLHRSDYGDEVFKMRSCILKTSSPKKALGSPRTILTNPSEGVFVTQMKNFLNEFRLLSERTKHPENHAVIERIVAYLDSMSTNERDYTVNATAPSYHSEETGNSSSAT